MPSQGLNMTHQEKMTPPLYHSMLMLFSNAVDCVVVFCIWPPMPHPCTITTMPFQCFQLMLLIVCFQKLELTTDMGCRCSQCLCLRGRSHVNLCSSLCPTLWRTSSPLSSMKTKASTGWPYTETVSGLFSIIVGKIVLKIDRSVFLNLLLLF